MNEAIPRDAAHILARLPLESLGGGPALDEAERSGGPGGRCLEAQRIAAGTATSDERLAHRLRQPDAVVLDLLVIALDGLQLLCDGGWEVCPAERGRQEEPFVRSDGCDDRQDGDGDAQLLARARECKEFLAVVEEPGDDNVGPCIDLLFEAARV